MTTKLAGILGQRKAYKPFQYPQLFDIYTTHEKSHWLPTEVPMADDIADFNSKLTKAEKNLITQILRFFTQGDTVVADNYHNHIIPKFKIPEVSMMLGSFANREAIHQWAYSQLNDTLGLPDEDYNAFLEYDDMRNKYDYMKSFKSDSIEDLMINMAVFGGFIEGVSLFASFAILMNFPRRGLLKNVGQIVTWSAQEEGQHSDGVSTIFKILCRENPALVTDRLVRHIQCACDSMVHLEDKFIDLCYEQGPVDGLTTEQLKQYIRYLADLRLVGLGLSPIYNIKTNPLPWMEAMLYGKEFGNFFETRTTEYSKGSIQGDFFD